MRPARPRALRSTGSKPWRVRATGERCARRSWSGSSRWIHAVHCVAFAAVALAALALRWDIDAVHGWANSMLDALASGRAGNGGASTHGLIAALLRGSGTFNATPCS